MEHLSLSHEQTPKAMPPNHQEQVKTTLFVKRMQQDYRQCNSANKSNAQKNHAANDFQTAAISQISGAAFTALFQSVL